MRRTAITIVCLAIVLIAGAGYYMWRHSSPGAGPANGPAGNAEKSLISQLPSGAPYAVYADVAALRNAAFLSKLVAMVPAPAQDQDYTDFVRETGFDYSRDLDRVIITTIPGTTQSEVWALADGRFDQQKIQAYALRSGKTEQRDGQTVYVFDSGASGNEISLRFISPSRIHIVSRAKQPAPPVNSAKPNSNQSTATAPAPAPVDAAALRDRIARVSGSPVFAVLWTDAVPKGITIGSISLDSITSSIQNLHWLSFTSNPEGENLRVALDLECGSLTDSVKLEMTLSSLRVLGQMALSQPSTRRQFTLEGAAALDKLVKQLDIAHDGQHVRVTSVLSPDMISGFAAPPPNPAPAPRPKVTAH
jgi:hypothetical protein